MIKKRSDWLTGVLICKKVKTDFISLSGGGGAAGAGLLGALLPGNAGGGGPGLVHPVTRPQQPGSGAAAAAAQRAVGQRSPQ